MRKSIVATPALAGVLLLPLAAARSAPAAPQPSEALPAVEVVAKPDTSPGAAGSAVPEPAPISRPAAVDVWTGTELQTRGIQKLEDLQSRAPGLVARSGGTRALNQVLGMRGMVNNAFYGEPAVALYVDDVPYASTFTYDPSLLDVDHIDLYRGPQFTRWGRRAASGLISVYSRQPGDAFHLRAETQFASYDEQAYRIFMDGPLGETVGFTLSGSWSTRDGLLYNNYLGITPDDEQQLAGRFSLLWKPSPRWEVQVIAAAQQADDGVQRYTNLDSDPWTVAHDFRGVTYSNSDTESIRVRHIGDTVQFTSITARRHWRMDPGSFDLDFSPLPILSTSVITTQELYSQEFRFQPVRESSLDWFAGAYASWMPFDVLVDDTVYRGDSQLRDTTWAVFGDITKKFDNGFDLTLGLRAELVEKSAERLLQATAGPETWIRKERHDSNLSPKLQLTKHWTDDFLTYASTALNHRPGVYSMFNFQPDIQSADSEQNWANELGAKASFLDDKLEIALTGFWYEIKDYQIERYVLGGFGVTSADEVSSRGVELELTARPADGFELSAGTGYTHARFESYHDPLTGADLSGKHPPYIPDVTFNAAAQYKHPSGPMARVEWLFAGRTFYDDHNTAPGAQSSYGLLNARIGYEKARWGIWLYGKNLTDKEYYAYKIPTLGVGFPGEPRSLGIMASVSF